MQNLKEYYFYDKLSIFELRNLARECGVKLPTTLKKKDLIQKIINIKKGIEKPYIKKNNQGRPHKPLYNFDIKQAFDKEIQINELNLNVEKIDYSNINILINFLNDFKELNYSIFLIIKDFINSYKEILKEE